MSLTSTDIASELQELRLQVEEKNAQIEALQQRVAKLEEGVSHRDKVIAQLAESRKEAFAACRTYTEQCKRETETKLAKMKRQLEMERQHHAAIFKDFVTQGSKLKSFNINNSNAMWEDQNLDSPPCPSSPESEPSDVSDITTPCCVPTAMSAERSGSGPLSPKTPTSKLPCSWAASGATSSRRELNLEDLLDMFDDEDDDLNAYAMW